MVPNFVSVTWHGDSFHGLVVQDVENLILLVLYFCLMEEGEEKERKKKRRKKSLWSRRFSLVLDLACWLCSRLHLLGANKG
jgi:hypothetical protein